MFRTLNLVAPPGLTSSFTNVPRSRLLDATDDLRDYVLTAQLPPLRYGPDETLLPPPDMQSPRFRLVVRPDRYQDIGMVYTLSSETWGMNVQRYTRAVVPNESISTDPMDDAFAGGSIALPSPHYNAEPWEPSGFGEPAVFSIEDIRLQAEHAPLATAWRIFHYCSTCAPDWRIEGGKINADEAQGFGVIEWISESDVAALIFGVEPWVFSERDLAHFATNDSLYSRPPIPLDDTGLSNEQKLWSLVLDRCQKKRCQTFIVTTYEHWVFGHFSQGYTNAFATKPWRGNSADPNILQCLVYVMGQSAMRVAASRLHLLE
ncbi:hypothetical protein BOTBODRAFT_354738 [Botryobasidium botryosum FD-172 SS1]|uniref:Uncharacterized protein n=1 Tax=Botryobasidium botryosum (strain FD-172 SS1) TaxID=930990 RepID=A0A067MQR3_BOTB1|nr:hypothetical protein BOTBODRAFT_354738 [Botryobasidium botryosum FD-172 SS1]